MNYRVRCNKWFGILWKARVVGTEAHDFTYGGRSFYGRTRESAINRAVQKQGRYDDKRQDRLRTEIVKYERSNQRREMA